MDMATGKADPQKLFFAGKMKVSGNMMAAMKLDFLKHVDKDAAMKAYAAKHGGGAQQQAAAPAKAAAAPAPSKDPQAPKIFNALKDRLSKNGNLHGEVRAALQFVVRGPDSKWVVDLTSGPGSVKEGTANAAATFTLSDEDLSALVSGKAQVKDLYQRGRLRIDGDVRLAHKLGFMNNLI
jgi:3-hydroxyacyl-CoA dehydrogenase/3a,7a,12a-trihydroxy-5b-cholest-24-enoyl-CoA hydratase